MVRDATARKCGRSGPERLCWSERTGSLGGGRQSRVPRTNGGERRRSAMTRARALPANRAIPSLYICIWRWRSLPDRQWLVVRRRSPGKG